MSGSGSSSPFNFWQELSNADAKGGRLGSQIQLNKVIHKENQRKKKQKHEKEVWVTANT